MDRTNKELVNFIFGYLPFTIGPFYLIYLAVKNSQSWFGVLAPGPLLFIWASIFVIAQLYILTLNTNPKEESIVFVSICFFVTFINMVITPVLLGSIFSVLFMFT